MSALYHRNDRWSVLSAFAQWWRRWAKSRSDLSELESCGPDQTERIAQDLGMPASELRLLVSHGPDEPELLRRRLATLHLDPDELAGSEPAMLRDLQRLCTMCRSRGRCARDFAQHAADPAWQGWRDYCPNAATLNMLSTLKICADASKAGVQSANSRTGNESQLRSVPKG